MRKTFSFAVAGLLAPFMMMAQIPSGFIAEYQLNNTAADISGNNYNGSLSSTSATTNRFGAAGSATALTAGSSVGTLPVALVTAVQNDFTVGFWFMTTMNASSSSQWYGGNSLVDAEVCGGTSDWGTALIDGGRVCMGIGNPDITIKSTAAGYNDGNWHFVTATRNRTSGTIILYMEGVQVATLGSTTTAALVAPNSIRLGSNPCAPNCVYTGSLDDIIVYDRVLSSTEVLNLYNHMSAFTLPLQWLSFTADLRGSNAQLKWETGSAEQNDHFEIEHSTDGIHFTRKGSRLPAEGVTTIAGSSVFTFPVTNLAKGNHYFRIRQVDTDGRFSFSKTLQMTVRNSAAAFYLQTNPVGDQLLLVNTGLVKVVRLQVADLSGKILLDQTVQSAANTIETGVQQLKPGYYF